MKSQINTWQGGTYPVPDRRRDWGSAEGCID